ncbi:hypothetical protein GDO86_004663 [Hymenochirus boettgeri]|uniref:Uncharacterized protein n=1 Tax=Hymenochirus boettgeri TaxID=247094 RepID=A0A8T2KAM8_9PIPI|nr:hypothetical protein GDO86_004663 [Hymenochirus boettgeri]
MACERGNLERLGLSEAAISTLMAARKPSTSKNYYRTWKVFVEWCTSNENNIQNLSAKVLVEFLQSGLEKNFFSKYTPKNQDVNSGWEETSNSVKSFPYVYTEEQEQAAGVIQRAFRRILAELIDVAAGVHVRFRLGGTHFPPNIYYKLFTHRPIVDMCANSPKDYTQNCLKQLVPKQIHNRGPIPKQDLSGWYKRIENNGWRLLTLRVSNSLDLVTTVYNRKKIPFHHSRLQRKQDLEKKQKQRKIEWMKKMYYEGSLHAKTTDPEIAMLVQQATQGVIQTADESGTNHVMDWEVDELLNWTNALDFDEYIGTWKEIGTSKSSCAFKGSAFIRSPYDQYEFSQISLNSQGSLDISGTEEE